MRAAALLLFLLLPALAGASLEFGVYGEAFSAPGFTDAKGGPYLSAELDLGLEEGARLLAAGRARLPGPEGELEHLLLEAGPLRLGYAPIWPGEGRYLAPFAPAGRAPRPLVELTLYPAPDLRLKAGGYAGDGLELWGGLRWQTPAAALRAELFYPRPAALHLAASGALGDTVVYAEAALGASPSLLLGLSRYLGEALATLEAGYQAGAAAFAFGLEAEGGGFLLALEGGAPAVRFSYREQEASGAFELTLGFSPSGAQVAARLGYFLDLDD